MYVYKGNIMEIKGTKELLTGQDSDIELKQGVNWLVFVDVECAEEIYKVITLMNEKDVEYEIFGVCFKETSELKSWVSTQGIKFNFFLATNEIQENLKIVSVPWFVCVENSQVVYSSGDLPSGLEFLQHPEDELTELKSPEKQMVPNSPEKIKKAKSPEKYNNSVSPELPNFSQLLKKDTETELENALKKIDKLKLKVSQQEQTIEDYKSEIRQLKALLGSKSKDSEPETSLRLGRNSVKVQKNPANVFQPRINARIDENDFWKIDERDDFQESIKFEDNAVSKDLWLMGLFKSPEAYKPKPVALLPPLQIDRNKNSKSLQRDNSRVYKERKNSSKNPTSSIKKLKK